METAFLQQRIKEQVQEVFTVRWRHWKMELDGDRAELLEESAFGQLIYFMRKLDPNCTAVIGPREYRNMILNDAIYYLEGQKIDWKRLNIQRSAKAVQTIVSD